MIETIYSNPNELYHYGVKGMKWGVRKVPDSFYNIKRKMNKNLNSDTTLHISSKQKKKIVRTAGLISATAIGAIAIHKLYNGKIMNKGHDAVINMFRARDPKEAGRMIRSMEKANKVYYGSKYLTMAGIIGAGTKSTIDTIRED